MLGGGVKLSKFKFRLSARELPKSCGKMHKSFKGLEGTEDCLVDS